MLVAHRTRPGWLDTAVDARIRASLGGHQVLLGRVALLGTTVPLIVMTAALVLACLATRRWRGAALAAIGVPAADALTELLIKPLVRRTTGGGFSYPSGHATSAFAVAAVVAVLLLGPLRPKLPAAARLALTLAALLAACAVSVAVIGLHYHYFTDTVGGAAVAVATVLVTALILDKAGPSRQPPRPAPDSSSLARGTSSSGRLPP